MSEGNGSGNGEGTLALTVSLDVDANPPVVISNRSPVGQSNIQWQKTGSLQFTFEEFEPEDDTVLKNKDVTDNKITCDFAPPAAAPSDTEYPYTISVLYDEKTYTSDETGPQIPGRAVIKN